MEQLCQVAVQYGCCEIGYIEDGVAEPELVTFFADEQAPCRTVQAGMPLMDPSWRSDALGAVDAMERWLSGNSTQRLDNE